MLEERMVSGHSIPVNVLLNKKKIFTFLFKIGLQKIVTTRPLNSNFLSFKYYFFILHQFILRD